MYASARAPRRLESDLFLFVWCYELLGESSALPSSLPYPAYIYVRLRALLAVKFAEALEVERGLADLTSLGPNLDSRHRLIVSGDQVEHSPKVTMAVGIVFGAR